MGYYDTWQRGIGTTGYPDMMDEDAERRRRVRESLAQPGPVLRTSVIEPMRIASGGYRSNGVSASGSNGMTDERAMGMFADRSGMNAAARAGLNVGGGSRPKELIDPSMALRIKNDMIQKEAGKRYGTLMEDTGPWAGSVSNAYLQYKASNMMNSGADRRAAQAELARRSAREAQTEQIAGNIGVAAEQAKGLVAAGQVKLDVAKEQTQAKLGAAETIAEAKVKSAEIAERIKQQETEARERTQKYSDDTKRSMAKDQNDVTREKITQLANDSTLDAETKLEATRIAGQWHIDAAQMKSDQLTELLVGMSMLDKAQTPEEKKAAINKLKGGSAQPAPATATATSATGAGTAAAANTPAGGSALDANLPVYTPEQAKNLKPGIRFKGSDGKIRTT